MSEPVTQVAKAAVAGIKEALAVGKELESVTKDIQDLGKADVQARAAFRKKQLNRPKDTSVFSAVEEWRGVYEIKKIEEELKHDIIEKHGHAAWAEIEAIKQRILADNKNLTDEFGRDLKKLNELKIYCFLASLFIVTTYYIFKGHL
jgi:chromatin segregation and condensation protein Rec8/ScpA/Scc1 (kleisin family)